MLPLAGSCELLCWPRSAFGTALKGSAVFVGICAGFNMSGAGEEPRLHHLMIKKYNAVRVAV